MSTDAYGAATSGLNRFPGLPYREVQLWLDNVQDQLSQVRMSIEELQAEQAKLLEQENLLRELLAASAPD
jgi:hypothetical protein